MEDIAILCGGQVVSDTTGITLDRALAGGPVLGIAKRVIVTNENTVIVGGRGDEEDIENRIASIKTLIDKTTDEYELPKLKERLAKLTNGIGIITVGGETESELKEKRDRVDDAFAAATAAVKHGIVPGGGIALLRAQNYLNNNLICADEFVNYSVDEQTGIKILCNSLSAPIEKILSNADENASVIVRDVVLLNRITMGYDVVSKRYTDMIESGIIDPTEVVINEVNNASSIAGLLLTTSCIITDKIEEK
jgi:chaperonin GroEL